MKTRTGVENQGPKAESLRSIPGVGKAVEQDLISLGVRAPADLRGKDPEELYGRLCKLQGKKVDRCMLYTLRCAVYYVSNKKHEPALLKWWNWKDEDIALRALNSFGKGKRKLWK